MAKNHVRGGKRLKKFIRDALRAKDGPDVEVGFFATAKYPDGTPVALVAAVNEFGTDDGHIPERPFFRNAIRKGKEPVREVLAENLTHENGYALDRRTLELVGHQLTAEIKKSIVTLRDPPNAPSTIKAKGSANPLIGKTSTMILAVTHRVVE